MVLLNPVPTHDDGARRTQQQRRERAQTRLLEATVDCLVDLGWSGTSTTEVAKRAGLSRGAQQHHYRTKMELVTAAVEYLLEKQRAEFECAFAELPEDRRNIDGALDLLWDVYRGPVCTAILELAVAARTDEELRQVCAHIPERIHEITIETFDRLFPETQAREIMPDMIHILLALYAGLSLEYGVDRDRRGRQAKALEHIKLIARALLPEGSG